VGAAADDHVVYRAGPDWRMRRHGLVRLVLCAVGGSTCHALVVQRFVTDMRQIWRFKAPFRGSITYCNDFRTTARP